MLFRWQPGVEHREPLARREIDQVLAVDVQAVEEERRERRAVIRGLRAEPAHGHLERLGTAVLAQRDGLPVQDDRGDVERADR